MVNVLLRALALNANRDKPACVVRVVANLFPQSLVIVVTIVDNDPPFASNVLSSLWLNVLHSGWANHSFRASPVSFVIRAGAFGCSCVERVVPFGLTVTYLVNKVFSRLFWLVGIFNCNIMDKDRE